MDPCPVIREPLSGARDRTTLGQAQRPDNGSNRATIYVYVEMDRAHCVSRKFIDPPSIQNFPPQPSFSLLERDYARNLHLATIKSPDRRKSWK